MRLPARCQDLELVVYVAESLNCAMDLIMIALPVRVISTLQLSRNRKIVISGMFLLGAL